MSQYASGITKVSQFDCPVRKEPNAIALSPTKEANAVPEVRTKEVKPTPELATKLAKPLAAPNRFRQQLEYFRE